MSPSSFRMHTSPPVSPSPQWLPMRVVCLLSTASKYSEALSDYVLGEFTRTEKKELDSIIADACDAVEHWIEEEDMAKVMTRFNSPR